MWRDDNNAHCHRSPQEVNHLLVGQSCNSNLADFHQTTSLPQSCLPSVAVWLHLKIKLQKRKNARIFSLSSVMPDFDFCGGIFADPLLPAFMPVWSCLSVLADRKKKKKRMLGFFSFRGYPLFFFCTLPHIHSNSFSNLIPGNCCYF